jgi:hypothetical protein
VAINLAHLGHRTRYDPTRYRVKGIHYLREVYSENIEVAYKHLPSGYQNAIECVTKNILRVVRMRVIAAASKNRLCKLQPNYPELSIAPKMLDFIEWQDLSVGSDLLNYLAHFAADHCSHRCRAHPNPFCAQSRKYYLNITNYTCPTNFGNIFTVGFHGQA